MPGTLSIDAAVFAMETPPGVAVLPAAFQSVRRR